MLSPSRSSSRVPTRTIPTRTSISVSTRPSSLQASRSRLPGHTTSCDLWIDAAQGSGHVFYGITFDSTFDASAQTTTVQNGLKMYAGPYGGNGLDCCSDGKSRTTRCQDPNDWMPDKTYSGTETGGATMTCTEFVESSSDIKTQDFTTSWSCDGKSAAIQSNVQDLGASIMGCCGLTKKSACSNTRAHVCENPSTFLPSHTFKSDDGMFDGTCYTAVGTTNTDATSDCYGELLQDVELRRASAAAVEIARKGCCGTSGEPASACHGHYSGAASSQHVIALAAAVAVFLAEETSSSPSLDGYRRTRQIAASATQNKAG